MNQVLRRWRTALAMKWMWLAHAYSFNWAHKPLCERFRHDVVRIGHVHLCRSCLVAYTGMGTGLALVAHNPAWLQAHGTPIFFALAATTVTFSLPHWYKRWPRPTRDVLRFCMGLTIALCGYVLLTGDILAGLFGAVALIAFWRFYLALRRQRRLESCAGCPELELHTICSGYRRQAEHVRAYEEEATAWVMAHQPHSPVSQGRSAGA